MYWRTSSPALSLPWYKGVPPFQEKWGSRVPHWRHAAAASTDTLHTPRASSCPPNNATVLGNAVHGLLRARVSPHCARALCDRAMSSLYAHTESAGFPVLGARLMRGAWTVNGPDTCDVWADLKSVFPGTTKWNFDTKFLVRPLNAPLDDTFCCWPSP